MNKYALITLAGLSATTSACAPKQTSPVFIVPYGTVGTTLETGTYAFTPRLDGSGFQQVCITQTKGDASNTGCMPDIERVNLLTMSHQQVCVTTNSNDRIGIDGKCSPVGLAVKESGVYEVTKFTRGNRIEYTICQDGWTKKSPFSICHFVDFPTKPVSSPSLLLEAKSLTAG